MTFLVTKLLHNSNSGVVDFTDRTHHIVSLGRVFVCHRYIIDQAIGNVRHPSSTWNGPELMVFVSLFPQGDESFLLRESHIKVLVYFLFESFPDIVPLVGSEFVTRLFKRFFTRPRKLPSE